jgi:hypothetical protein
MKVIALAIDAPATPPPRPDEDPRDRPDDEPEVPSVPPTEPQPVPVVDPPPEAQPEPPYIVRLARFTASVRRSPEWTRWRAC